jgi:hypothetical protein
LRSKSRSGHEIPAPLLNSPLELHHPKARRQAALKLGAAQVIQEHHNAEQGLPLAENFLLDLRYAFRMLHRSPGFSLIVIATMALGVGATIAIYSVIDATLLHPLPFPHPNELGGYPARAYLLAAGQGRDGVLMQVRMEPVQPMFLQNITKLRFRGPVHQFPIELALSKVCG